MTRRTSILEAALLSAVLLAGKQADATGADASAKSNCFEAHEQGQLSRNGGHLSAARASFLQCANEACPALVRKDCLEWVEQVSAAQPTVIIAATDPQGRDTGDVRFFVDNEKIAERLTGVPFVLDPGEHTFRFEMAGADTVERRVLLREGDRDRKVIVQFTGKPSSTPAPSLSNAPLAATVPSAPFSPLTYGLAGTSLAALGVFSYFAIMGKSLEHDRASTCSPRCSPEAIAPIKRDYLIADVALGLGLVTAAVATWSALSRESSPPAQSGQWLDVRATNGGAKLVVGHEF